MRTPSEVEEYTQRARQAIVYGCARCQGVDADCDCYKRYNEVVAAYEACVPRDFWNIKPQDVDHNFEVFRGVVIKYIEQLQTALNRGYGLVFLGDNGVGKTFFISFILMTAIRTGKSAYYTTLPQLDYNIKRGFNSPEVEEQLRWMLTSDFLAIDEMGKEKYKADPSTFLGTQVERIFKQRCDDSMPVILATNMDFEALIDAYGPTVGSIISGKFQPVMMKPGDYRRKLAKRMGDEMGY